MPERRSVSTQMAWNTRVAELSATGQLLMDRLILATDVDGRLPGEAKVIRQMCLPLVDIEITEVEQILDKMLSLKDAETDCGLIERYEIKGNKYIWLPGWEFHQRGRPKNNDGSYREAKSRIPPPPHELLEKGVVAESAVSAVSITQLTGDKSPVIKDAVESGSKLGNMMTYYEEKTGRKFTTPDADRLRDIVEMYPSEQFEKAVDEAVKQGKRTLSYISGILENWRKKEKPARRSYSDSNDNMEEE